MYDFNLHIANACFTFSVRIVANEEVLDTDSFQLTILEIAN